MNYKQKYQNQKTILGLSTAVVILVLVMAFAFLVGPSLVSSGSPDKTPPPQTTPTPLVGDVKFYDEHLEIAVKNALGVEGEVTNEDMQRLTVLEYDEGVIKDLEGLQYAINLKELKIRCDLFELSPIVDLQIEKLTLICQVSAQPLMEELATMEYIKYLDLTDCGISIIGFLEELPVLETLILDKNRVSDLQYVYAMKKLKTLSIKENNLKEVNELYNNTSIEYLYLDNNKIDKDSLELVVNSMLQLRECTWEGNPVEEDSEE